VIAFAIFAFSLRGRRTNGGMDLDVSYTRWGHHEPARQRFRKTEL
jgi:hypothetical protein